MTQEISGLIKKVGKVKAYDNSNAWDREITFVFKFFMEVENKDGIYLAMVTVDGEMTEWGPRIKKDGRREKPLIGDKVRFTTHRIREGKDGARWCSVTWNQEFEITYKSESARQELADFIARKKAEREEAYQQKLKEQEEQAYEAKAESLSRQFAEENDDRIPQDVRDEFNSVFNWDRLFNVLKQTQSPIDIGEAPHMCPHGGPRACGCQTPGSGLRYSHTGALYGLPRAHRNSVIKKALKTNLITIHKESDDEDSVLYIITERGRQVLESMK